MRQVIIIHHIRRPDGSQQMLETGISIPVHASALGKVLLTYHDEQAASVLSRPLRALTGDTITDPEQLRTQLTEVGRIGLAFERDEAASANPASPPRWSTATTRSWPPARSPADPDCLPATTS